MCVNIKRFDDSIQLPQSKTRCGQMLASKNNSGRLFVCLFVVIFMCFFYALCFHDFHLYFDLHSPLLFLILKNSE